MKNNKWKARIRQLNYSYLTLVREIIQSGDQSSLTLLGLDVQAMEKLAETENWILENLADVGVTLFKLGQEQIDHTLSMANTGQDQRAQALIMMGAISNTGEWSRG